MKVQCPSCREIIEMKQFSTSEEGLHFTCPDCHEKNFLPNPLKVACKAGTEARGEKRGEITSRVEASQEMEAPRDMEVAQASSIPVRSPSADFKSMEGEGDEVVCPKCGHAQIDSEACHVCGLSFALFDAGKMQPDPVEAVELWNKVLEAPDDLHLHDSFVDACNKADRLDYAHRQYRIFERETGRIEVAETMRYRVQELAQVQLGAFDLGPSAAYGDPARRRKVLWIIVAIIGLIWIAYVVIDSLAIL